MRGTILTVAIVLILLFLYILFKDIQWRLKLRNIPELKDCTRYFQFKTKVLQNPTKQNLQLLEETQTLRRRLFTLWLAGLSIGVVIIVMAGVMWH